MARSSLASRPMTLALPLIASLLLAACAAEETAAPGGIAAVPAAVPGEVACAHVEGPITDVPGWPLMPEGTRAFIPVVATQLVTVGPTRFLFNVLSPEGDSLAAARTTPRIDFYAIERDPQTPYASVEAAYLDTGLGHGLYRAVADFDCPGEWGAEVFFGGEEGEDAPVAGQRLRFQVHAAGTTPAIGAPAPRSDSPTATGPDELARISTDPEADPDAYARSIAEVVSGGVPSMVFFATPAFCQTGYCGPTVQLVKSVADEYEDQVGFVMVEPYELQMTENGLQPRLDEDGRLQPVQAVLDYGIPVEPYLFVVDAEGEVFAKFEGVVAADELRVAIEDALAAAA